MNEISTISGIRCYETNGVAYLDLETVARGLGFTKKADSGNEVVNWTRVRSYLADLGVVQKCTTGDYIPENIFYRLAMKAKNETAERFQALVADEVIPAIRRTGSYSVKGISPSAADYLKAAQIVSRCTDKRLQIVLSLLNAGGIHVEIPAAKEQPIALTTAAEPIKPVKRKKRDGQPVYSEEDCERLAREVRSLIMTSGYTVSAIAEITGVERSQLSKYKHGWHYPHPERAEHIIKTLTAAIDGKESITI